MAKSLSHMATDCFDRHAGNLFRDIYQAKPLSSLEMNSSFLPLRTRRCTVLKFQSQQGLFAVCLVPFPRELTYFLAILWEHER